MNILVNRDGAHLGPYSYDQACQLIAEGKLQAWDIAWPDGGREWVTLDQIDGLTERAFAIREQRLAESMNRSKNGPAQPNAQFITSKKSIRSPKRDWKRVWVWTLMALTVVISLIVWNQKFNKKILLDNVEHRSDSLHYIKNWNKPFTGIAYAKFNDGSLWEKTSFENGVRHGNRSIWHMNGKLALKETYYNGSLKKAYSYDYSGKLSGQYIEGSGTITLYWNETGLRSQEQVYSDWKVVKRTIWNREGKMLSVIPPPNQSAQLVNPSNSTTNKPPPNPPVKTASTNSPPPIPGLLPARAILWSIGETGTSTVRQDIEKRVDLVYANKYYTKIIEDFGNPDEIIEGRIYAYRNMRVRRASNNTICTKIHFHFINGKTTLIEALP